MKNSFLLVLFTIINLAAFGQMITVSGMVKRPANRHLIFTMLDKDVFTGEASNHIVEVKLNEHNIFNVRLPVNQIAKWEIRNGGMDYVEVALQPNKDLNFDIDENFYIDTASIGGSGAEEVRFDLKLQDFINEKYPYASTDSMKKLSLKQTMGFWNARIKSEINFLNEYKLKHSLCEEYQQWAKAKIKYGTYLELVQQKLIFEKSVDSTVFDILGVEHFSDNAAAKYSPEYNIIIETYIFNKVNNSPGKRTGISALFAYTYSNFKESTRDYNLTGRMIKMIQYDSVFNAMKPQFLKLVKDPELILLVNSRRNQFLENAKKSLLSDPDVSGKKTLAEIFDMYKGKVIYVDFWASWCGPCKAEMPYAAILKRKMKNKNIVFLYLGFQDQKRAWMASRKELSIEGEHVLLNDELTKDAYKVFKIKAIPLHAIVDQQGNIVSKDAPRASSADLEKMLESLID